MGGVQTHSSRENPVQNYTRQITPDTPPADRLARSRAFLDVVSRQMAAGVRYDDDTVLGVITALLRVTLDSTHTTPELRDWLLSPEVKKVVWALATGPGTASVVLRGMVAAVSVKGVGFEGMNTWSAVLANRWLVRPNKTVTPTHPGFVLDVFTLTDMCSERQKDVCGHRNVRISTMDTELLPLVTGALPTETGESINQGDRDGDTALHYAAALRRLPQVNSELLAHEAVNVNARNNKGYTPLTRLIATYTTLDVTNLPPARVLLGDTRTDVTILDNGGKTVLDYCHGHLGDSEEKSDTDGESTRVALEVISLISNHGSFTALMLTTGLEFLLSWEAPASQRDLYNDVTISLAANTKCDINKCLRDGKTACHMAASKGNGHIVLRFINIDGFDPKVRDGLGNTVLHYVCEKMSPEQSIEILKCQKVQWEYTLTNVAGQTALDYYRALGLNNPIMMSVLQTRTHGDKCIRWAPFQLTTQLDVKASTADFTARKSSKMVYDMSHANKGKAGIIAIHTFSDATKNLSGYKQDQEDLAALWDGLGFKVLVPERRNSETQCLTAEEVVTAVKQFAREVLNESDLCAVLCILSHGGDGFLCGSDFHTVDTTKLLQELDNVNCKQMAGKPKVVIIQACQGDSSDHGFHVRASPSLPQAAAGGWSDTHLPSVSDFMIGTPSSRGYVSFVGKRSFYIRTLVRVFAKFACKKKITALLTRVNREVSEETVRAEKVGTTFIADHKQMPQFSSTLRKGLYFFPCPREKDGDDLQT